MYILDTNAIIYHLKGDQEAMSTLRQIFSQGHPVYVSSLTVTELLSFSKITKEEILAIEDFLKIVAIIPVDLSIAKTAGFLSREYKLKIADSIISATALFTGSKLVTRNIRDFNKVPNIQILKI